MICIFQTAGDPTKYEKRIFEVKGKSYSALLSSEAYRSYLEEMGREAETFLLIPESFLVKRSLEEFCKLFEERGVVGFKPLVIPSAGRFDGETFETTTETVVTAIFLHLLKLKPEELYVDITTGFNLYPISLVEAVKRYLTYRKLEGILQGEEVARAFTLFAPAFAEKCNVEVQPISVKAFFSLPNADVDKFVREVGKFGKIVGDVNKRYSGVKEKFRRLFYELRIAYNAIRLNTPLAFYELIEMNANVEEIEKELQSFVEELLSPIRNGKTVRLPIDGVNVSNAFYSTALYKSVQRFSATLSNAEIDEILSRFSELYGVGNLGVGVNRYFLERDVEDIRAEVKRAVEEGRFGEGMEEIYGRIKHGEKFTESSVKPRNFYAHSGFLMEYTLVKLHGGKIYLRWLEDRKKEIMSWLLEPEK